MSPTSYQRRIVTWLLDHRVVVMALVCLATLVLVAPLRNPQVLIEQHNGQEKADEGGEELKDFARKFGEGELMMVVIKADDVFTPEVLTYVQSVTDAAAKVTGVLRVASLTTVKEVLIADGATTTRPLFPAIPTDAETLKRKKATALSNPLWMNNLISADATVTMVNIFLPPLTRGSLEGSRIVRETRELLPAGKPDGVKVFLTGLSPMFEDSMSCAQKDFNRFFWLTWLLMAVLLFLAFGTLRGVLLPLGVVFLSVLWTLGLMVIMGQTITTIGAMVPTMIAITCFSDTVQVMGRYYEQAQHRNNRREVLLETMELMITACFLTSFTTAVAFGSLIVANLSNIRQFGIWTAVGIMLGYVLNTVLMPVVLSWLPLPGPRIQRRYEHSLIGKMLARAVAVNRLGRWWVPGTAVILVVVSLLAASQLRVETSLAAFLPKSASSIQGLAIVQDKLTGFGSVELVLKGPTGCFREPWALNELRKIEMYLKTRKEVGFAFAVTDLLQWTHSIVEQTNADVLSDPNARGLVAEYLFLFSSSGRASALTSLLTEDGSEARISVRLRVAGTGEQLTLIADIEKALAERLDKRLTHRTTGEAERIHKQVATVIRSQTDSFGYTVLVITILMAIHLRSVKAGLTAMIPNLLPVVMTAGVMGVTGISLNFATVMIASIALGNAMNDTIHFLARYKREMRTGADRGEAVANTILYSGRALVFTDVAMAAGCGIFMLSEFEPNRHFGFLMAFAMIAALFADLLLTPYLVKTWKV